MIFPEQLQVQSVQRGSEPRLIALLPRGLQLEPAQLHGCGGRGAGAHDNVTRLQMKHPHLHPPPPSLSKSINGTKAESQIHCFPADFSGSDPARTAAPWASAVKARAGIVKILPRVGLLSPDLARVPVCLPKMWATDFSHPLKVTQIFMGASQNLLSEQYGIFLKARHFL